jgi:hypothetical protein
MEKTRGQIYHSFRLPLAPHCIITEYFMAMNCRSLDRAHSPSRCDLPYSVKFMHHVRCSKSVSAALYKSSTCCVIALFLPQAFASMYFELCSVLTGESPRMICKAGMFSTDSICGFVPSFTGVDAIYILCYYRFVRFENGQSVH